MMNDEANSDEHPVAAAAAATTTATATATVTATTTAIAITPVADIINHSRMRTSLIDKRQRDCHLSNNNNENDTNNISNGGNIVEVVVGGDVHDGCNVKNYKRIARVVTGAYGTSRSGEIKFNQWSNWVFDPFFKVMDIGWMETKTKQEGWQGNGLFLSSEATPSHS
eukprot:CAMPEP_0170852712 /NCGR_PEP_ID=MMETSP0734-20130129/12055_1 /TAXON_ID=186038 /ORGANISM="Fragilariopsis kerguelensis, Strain L26-C5" /LENGTH=166 /DNA_ID=CAMNT_0011223201 /DNA_START=66 /DNA_END=566 /DNA_ORIENTATION=+